MTLTVATYNVHRCVGRDGRRDTGRVLDVLLQAPHCALRVIATHLGLAPAERRCQIRRILALDRIWVEPRGLREKLTAHSTALARAASDHLPLKMAIAWPPDDRSSPVAAAARRSKCPDALSSAR